MKVGKVNVFLACIVFLVVLIVFLFDGYDLNYLHARWKNGNELIGGVLNGAKLQDNFYFFEKDIDKGNYLIFHRYMSDIPIVLDQQKIVDPQMLLAKEAIEVHAIIDGCRVFRDAKNLDAFLVEHKAGVISYVNTEQEEIDWGTICGMVVFEE